MIKIYRLMCDKEFNSVCSNFPFSWNKSCKWFTDDVNFLKRVSDGLFGNSKFKTDRYKHLVEYLVEDINTFERVSDKEIMLRRKHDPKVKVISVKKIKEFSFDLV